MKFHSPKTILRYLYKRAVSLIFRCQPIGFKNNNRPKCFSLKRKEVKAFQTFILSPGEYALSILHQDKVLNEHSRGIVTRLSLPGFSVEYAIEITSRSASKLKNRRAAYIEPIYFNEDGYVASCTFRVKKRLPWLLISFRSSLDRHINIDEVVLENIEPESLDWPANTITSRKMHDSKSLLYADIDPNIIDGSSIWLASMASILCSQGACILLAKRSLTTSFIFDNVSNNENLHIVSPDVFKFKAATLSVDHAIRVIKEIDADCPNLQRIVVRGTKAAAKLVADRRFKYRTNIYLTDFYEQIGDEIVISEDNAKEVTNIIHQRPLLLTQTEAISSRISDIANMNVDIFKLPPPIPDIEERFPSTWIRGNTIKIGYAGKIAPKWGVIELFKWVKELRASGYNIQLTMIGNKVSGYKDTEKLAAFRKEIEINFKQLDVDNRGGLSRHQTLAVLSEMDYVWCYRPAYFENTTLELSSKLVEAAASGFAAIAFPNKINKHLLGKDYPYFIETKEDFALLLDEVTIAPPEALKKSIRETHSVDNISKRFSKTIPAEPQKQTRLLIAGHDLKFIDAYYSHLKDQGYSISIDTWNWGKPIDIERSKLKKHDADVVFCEWGLCNAVWYANNIGQHQKLIVRVHLQEINLRAARFGKRMNHDNVDTFIFVSDRVRQTAIEMFGWPEEKTVVIPNFVLDDEYTLKGRRKSNQIRLGMVGIIPQRKRLDKAIDVLKCLLKDGYDATLAIKGPRPETMEFMRGPSRIQELEFYQEQYERLESHVLQDRVVFRPFGNDVADFYKDIDFILSPSDFESFHYALADGVLSGCLPIVWPWEEALELYTADWVVDGNKQAVKRIVEQHSLKTNAKTELQTKNRQLVCDRYGRDKVFAELTNIWLTSAQDEVS